VTPLLISSFTLSALDRNSSHYGFVLYRSLTLLNSYASGRIHNHSPGSCLPLDYKCACRCRIPFLKEPQIPRRLIRNGHLRRKVADSFFILRTARWIHPTIPAPIPGYLKGHGSIGSHRIHPPPLQGSFHKSRPAPQSPSLLHAVQLRNSRHKDRRTEGCGKDKFYEGKAGFPKWILCSAHNLSNGGRPV